MKRTSTSRKILILAALALSAAAQTKDTRLSLRELTSEALKNNPEIVDRPMSNAEVDRIINDWISGVKSTLQP